MVRRNLHVTEAGRSRRRRHFTRSRSAFATAAATGTLVAGIALGSTAATAASVPAGERTTPHATPAVLLVGTYHGKKGAYSSIQAAVNAAKPGDWILIGPGDYHARDDHAHPPTAAQAAVGDMGGVLITTPGLKLRGMNRKTVIIDGTKPGAPKPCDSAKKWQDFGVTGPGGHKFGRNGIVIWKANDVRVDNLTVCNFLGGSGDSGNELWWNGGANSAKIGLRGYWSRYTTATSTYFGGESTAARYGIFSSNAAGPALWNQVYANNFNDSGMYVGACKQVCDMIITHAWMENNALGYSGTNSGGQIVVEHSVFDHNEDGFDTNTQIGADPPAPQNGRCPDGKISPITHTRSCWVFRNNLVYHNNNPSTPKAGSAAAGPTGTGMTVSGGRFDTIEHNTFKDNGAWGILFVPYPDSGTPVDNQTCKGTGGNLFGSFGCVYDPEGDVLAYNDFSHNGYFKNPTNSDFGQITLFGKQPSNCYYGNNYPDGSAPSNLEKIQPRSACDKITTSGNSGGPLLGQVLCDTGFGSCPPGSHYPTSSKVVLHSLPATLKTMANPCAGVPVNAWCPSVATTGSRGHTPQGRSPQRHGVASEQVRTEERPRGEQARSRKA